MILLSITGLFKTILILLGVFVLLRFFGQLLIAKRNILEQKRIDDERKLFEREKKLKDKYEGKIFISKKSIKAQDIDYEDVT